MHGRTDPAPRARRRTSHAASMSAPQRRYEVAAILAAGIARVVAARAEPADQSAAFSAESPAAGLALSPESRLSVRTGGKSPRRKRSEPQIGERP